MPFFYIGNEPNPDDRLTVQVSPEEFDRVCKIIHGKKPFEITISDVNTGTAYTVKDADCGLPSCRCAFELVSKKERA